MSLSETLRTLLDGPYPETRERVRWWLSQPGNEPVDDLPIEEHRERVLAWVRELSSEGDTAMGYPAEYGGKEAPYEHRGHSMHGSGGSPEPRRIRRVGRVSDARTLSGSTGFAHHEPRGLPMLSRPAGGESLA